jgi:hypothetical protein
VNGRYDGGEENLSGEAAAGLAVLQAATLGDPAITIAVLDGPVDLAHPCFAGAELTEVATLTGGAAQPGGSATAHGTHIASVLFGQPGSAVPGIAPRCRGLLLPVFADGESGAAVSCSQVDLARAITQAVAAGAHVINISGGEINPAGAATPLLAKAVQLCADHNILIVAAAGNEGCECLHVPAALPAVLAVGAMDAAGVPLDFSNWGAAYQIQGILAPGAAVLGATAGGGTAPAAGTSYATPLVAGAAALLLSLQRQQGRQPDPQAVRKVLLQTANPCDGAVARNCNRYLRGRLNPAGALQQVRADWPTSLPTRTPTRREDMTSSEAGDPAAGAVAFAADSAPTAAAPPPLAPVGIQAAAQPGVRPSQVRPAQAESGGPVFALGTLGYDFGADARRDWFVSVMRESGAVPEQADKLLDYFDNGLRGGTRPEDRRDYAASSVIWTLNLDATPIYAVVPAGPFADTAYLRLRQYLRDQLAAAAKIDATRVAVPGVVDGSITLRSGQVVPVIVPELRGMEQIKALPEGNNEAQKKEYAGANDLQSRLFYELRNLGVAPQERALNAIATYSILAVRTALTGHEIESVRAEKTPVARPGSDCWDVVVTTFVADKVYEAAKKVFRQTVDVSDVVPVFLGAPRIYSTM